MRTNGVLTWLPGDHPGSTSVTANADGTLASEQTYTAWGTTLSGTLPTDRQYTGQISEEQLGIYFYNARYYDPYLARFIQTDTIIPSGDNTLYLALIISYNEYSFLLQVNHAKQGLLNRPITNVPGNPVAFDRFAYANNNAQLYADPSSHDSYGNFTITTEEWVDYLRDASYVLIKMERDVKTWETVGEILGGGIGAKGGAIIGAPTGPGMALAIFTLGAEGTALGFGYWVGGGKSMETMEDVLYWMVISLATWILTHKMRLQFTVIGGHQRDTLKAMALNFASMINAEQSMIK
jgi:RHS repeat-associated protein